MSAPRPSRRGLLAAGLVLPLVAGPVRAAAPGRMVGFLSDFDEIDDAVAICRAVILSLAPDARLLDITHRVPPYDVEAGARLLAGSAPWLAADAVILVVVDPGVGSTRRAIVARTRRGQSLVLPDNGLITLLDATDPIVQAREITAESWMIGARRSSTFHGRDIFAPVVGRLARGDDWRGVGPEIDPRALIRLDLAPPRIGPDGARTRAIGTDGPYGNLILDLSAEAFAGLGWRLGETVPLTVAGRPEPAPYVRTFSDVPEGAVLLYPDSRGRMSLALNMGNYAAARGVGPGVEVFIPRRR
ncbi:SAM-dependent chlorinase/fluorinase [Phenylobacterium sp.]|uniref:SAM hydrolase/SAM-dependent halogenase family protein n=1 Tax=Phenylobacterium sp. TaxID=1871053 RepID=UPI0025E843C1|nr:SAM-dependent chlorinase/fluorinase [Phenylobacterium sp.]MCA3740285.1 SAM-dependent chlorinase/fluorinase [Phenylobacterium sp.]